MKQTKILFMGVVAAAFISCSSQKSMTDTVATIKAKTTSHQAVKEQSSDMNNLVMVQRVADKALYQKNLVSNLSFTLNNGKKDITVPGILRMRKDEVIRLQLLIPILRSEVGRIEFTKDYVLFIDRIHKQYVKAKYDEVGFLHDNGITFYTLQSLFWNQLFIPRKMRVSENDLSQFSVENGKERSNQPFTIGLVDGKMDYKWSINGTTNNIEKAQIRYNSSSHGMSMLQWTYNDFRPFGSKQFPSTQSLQVTTPATKQVQEKILKASFELDGFSAASDWDGLTTPSDKYTQVSVEEILGKLMNI